MKKLIAILTLTTLLVLSGCTGKPQSQIPDAGPSGSITADDGQIKNPAGEARLDEQDGETEDQAESV